MTAEALPAMLNHEGLLLNASEENGFQGSRGQTYGEAIVHGLPAGEEWRCHGPRVRITAHGEVTSVAT